MITDEFKAMSYYSRLPLNWQPHSATAYHLLLNISISFPMDLKKRCKPLSEIWAPNTTQ